MDQFSDARSVKTTTAAGLRNRFSMVSKCIHAGEIVVVTIREEISTHRESAALDAFHADLECGRLAGIIAENRTIFRRAETISGIHSARTGARSLDIWHVAAALESDCGTFASCADRQQTVASGCGLQLMPQEPIRGKNRA